MPQHPAGLDRIELVYFNAGGGHRSAADALDAVFRQQARPWRVRLVNLFDVLDPRSLFRKTTGINPEDFYNGRLARGWTLGLAQELKIFQAMIRLGHEALTKQLYRHWRRSRPDMVVSLVPNFNRSMYEALAGARPAAPFVTILTDLADYPPRFWIERGQNQHLICGTAKAVAQARAMRYAKSQVHPTSGVIIRPDFYTPLHIDRRSELRRLGFDPQRPTAIVMFGGHASSVMQTIAKQLAETQLILICGHNAALAKKLRALPARVPRIVVGFTTKIRYYMQLSDLFIGKPGPGSISEALHQGLPVIVVRNAWTMPQERYNTEWIQENNAGIVLDSFSSIRDGVSEAIRRIGEFQSSIARIRNRAVFEIPDILDRILRIETPQRAHRMVRRIAPMNSKEMLH